MRFPGAPTGVKMACGENPLSGSTEEKAEPLNTDGQCPWLSQSLR